MPNSLKRATVWSRFALRSGATSCGSTSILAQRRFPESLGSFDAQCAEFPMESFAFTHQVTRTLACNWKTYADNYLEGYHIPFSIPS